MIRDAIQRFRYRFELWRRERREEYFGSEMRPFWKLLIVSMISVALGLGIGIAIGTYYGEAVHIVIEPQRAKYESLESGYALFTWARSGKLCFAFMPKCKSGEFARNWFAKCAGECGMSRLEEELGAFPPGTSIEWRDWPEKFGYPQTEVIKRLAKVAKVNNIDLTFSPPWLD
jgi:hypothetical protein